MSLFGHPDSQTPGHALHALGTLLGALQQAHQQQQGQVQMQPNMGMQQNVPRQEDSWTGTDQLQPQNFNNGQVSQHGFFLQGMPQGLGHQFPQGQPRIQQPRF